nr:hypothetical protein [uncultured Allomuricauda sp.]
MPTYSGGDVEEIVCKHSLGTFRFQAKANEDFTINPGGFRSDDDDDAITGGGQMIDKINRKRWSIEGPVAVDTASENESKNLPLLSKSAELGVWTISLSNGTVYKGTGKPVGDLNFGTNEVQMPLKVAGGGILEPI